MILSVESSIYVKRSTRSIPSTEILYKYSYCVNHIKYHTFPKLLYLNRSTFQSLFPPYQIYHFECTRIFYLLVFNSLRIKRHGKFIVTCCKAVSSNFKYMHRKKLRATDIWQFFNCPSEEHTHLWSPIN